MLASRSFLICLSLSLVAALTGCEMFSSEAWQRPSPLTGRPLPPEKHVKRENQGGFNVLVEAPGQPTAARVLADIGTFAQARGFVRQSANSPAPAGTTTPGQPPTTPEQYASGDLKLDATFRASDLRVIASLHGFSAKLNHKFVDQFYQDFRQQYAGRYGSEGAIVENDETDDSGAPSQSNGSPRGMGRKGR